MGTRLLFCKNSPNIIAEPLHVCKSREQPTQKVAMRTGSNLDPRNSEPGNSANLGRNKL